MVIDNNKNGGFKKEKVKKFCEFHNYEYEAHIIPFLNLYSECPRCKEDRKERERLEKEREEAFRKEKERIYFIDYIKNYSNIPYRYIDFKIDYNCENFRKNEIFLKEPLNKNLLIIGNTGTGKTLFLSKVLINNMEKYPIYLNGNELNILKDDDFRINEILEKIDGKGIIAIDEAQELILNNRYSLLNIITDKAYNQTSKVVICGNIGKEGLNILSSGKFNRILSRLKQDGLNILNFGDKDLRI